MLTTFAQSADREAVDAPPAGASRAWTSDDPLAVQARELAAAGRFVEAESRLASAAADKPEHAEMLELLWRIRQDYGLDEAGMLAKLRMSIPDVTAADVDRWRSAGVLQHRLIDGNVWYFGREPANLFRFSDEARRRRDPRTVERPAGFNLASHLERVIAEAKRTGQAEVLPTRHRVTYTLTVPANVKGATAGSALRIWLPFPQEYRQQREVKLLSSSPRDPMIAPNGIKDGRVQRHAQRTLYFEQRITDPAKPHEFSARFEYVSSAYYPILRDEDARPLPADFDAQYLAERPPHIAFTPRLREAVKLAVGDETNPLRKARRVFEFVDATIRYCAEEEYGNIPGFSEHALTRRKGDCGVQGMLFITMCRAAGVPARWQSGFQTKPGSKNMHDWAEFYVEPWGWLPADPSYGLQKHHDPAVRYFYLGHQDAYRMIVNLDYGSPLTPEKRSLRSEPADFQRGEVELDGRNLYYEEWDYDWKVEYP